MPAKENAQMLQNGSTRKIKNEENEIDSSSSQTTSTTTTMYLKSIYKILNICTVLVLSIVICYLIFTFLTESESADHSNNLSFLETKWERTKRRTNSIYLASTTPLSALEQQNQKQQSSIKKKKEKNEKVELGKKLLKNGDSLGAETLCKSEIDSGTLKHSDYMNALVCLGEARLSLYNAAWNRGLLESEHFLIYDRLHLAKNNFDIAVSLEPTDLGARLGLGLAYFLIATREQSESSSQLLFNSILHFDAISVLASTTKEENYDHDGGDDGESISNEEIENIKISAMYNNALAHLALDDIMEATSILTQVSNLMDDDDDGSQSMRGISSVRTNLGAAVLQRGTASEQAIKKMNRSEVMKYCKRERFEKDEMGDVLSSAKLRFLHKQCSIFLNNISVAQETETSDSLTQEKSNNIDSTHDHVTLMDLSMLYEGKLGLQSASFASINSAEKIGIVPRLAMQSDHENDTTEYDSSSDDNMSTILNEATSFETSDVQESNMSADQWISFSRTKLINDDVEGAIDATTKALRVAKGFDEVKTCKIALEEALSHMSHETKESRQENFQKEISQSSSINNDIQILRLEKEVLSLKMQILQKSTTLDDTFIPREHDKGRQHGKDKSRQSENVNEEIQNGINYRQREDENIQILQEEEEMEINEEIATSLKQSYNNTSNLEISKVSNIDEDELNPYPTADEIEAEKGGSVQPDESHGDSKLKVQSDDISKDHNDNRKEQNKALAKSEAGSANKNELSTEEDIVDAGDFDKKLDSNTLIEPVENNEIGKDHIANVQDINLKHTDAAFDHSQDVADKSLDEKKQDEEEEEELILPELYKPVRKEVGPVDASSLAYMKVADAYIKKGNYLLASKQFQKVIKKSPSYIPANIGYATSMERYVKPKQLSDVARTYANVTIYAMEQDNSKLAEATFQRSLKVSKNIDGDRLESIKFLTTICLNNDLAAEVHYELGFELMKSNSSFPEALKAFKVSNAFASATNSSFSSKALFQIAKITFEIEGKLERALKLINSVLMQNLSELQADALVVSGQIKEKMLDVSGAIEDYKKAITHPKTDLTAYAYYNLGMLMKSEGGDVQTIENHIKMALDLGIDPQAEAIEILGDHHISVIKGAHRAEWKKYQEGMKSENKGRGGIMNGPGVTSKSIFSSKESGKDENEEYLDTLSILEQGAASYDGSSIPSGDEAVKGNTPNLSNQKRSSSAKVNQEKTLNI